ncbi:MAG: PAS domain-containing protein, partial [Rhodocyclaceae bacterium]|nr:PAS domain-containing protein [Rhodocyclaceae bacterium]
TGPAAKVHAGRAGRRAAGWVGALLIAAVLALAAYDIERSYRRTVLETGRKLDTQARVIAEQTARSLQAIDVVLRHFAERYHDGQFDRATPEQLHNYLREQAIGLVQSNGLVIFGADGMTLATSFAPPAQTASYDVKYHPIYKTLSERRDIGLLVESATYSRLDDAWIMPMARRLENREGKFAGVIGGRGRITYFQDFYRDIALEPGTSVTLMHRNDTLMARYPPVEGSLGKSYPTFEAMRKTYAEQHPEPTRRISAIDGMERFAALQAVPDYPLVVVVALESQAALAGWRAQAWASAARTLTLALLAATLLIYLLRQLGRLYAARASLEESRERYALAVSGSDDGIWDFNYVTNQAFASRRTREIHGLAPEPETQPLDRWLAELQFHPEDLPRRLAAMRAHLAGETPAYVGEFRIRHADGEYRWVRIHGLCLRDAQGRPQRMAGSVSDIDARKRAEQSLRVSEQRFAAAVSGSDVGIWEIDYAQHRAYGSRRCREILGLDLTPEEQSAESWHADIAARMHPDDVGRRAAALADHLAGRAPAYEVEYRIARPGGAWCWVHVHGRCLRDAQGQPLRMAGSTSDIDARKRAEQSLRESEQRFALAVAGSNDGIIDWDIVADRMFTSERTLQILGVVTSETMHTRAQWLSKLQLHADDRARHDEELRAYLDGRTALRDGEYRVLHPDGQYRWVRVRNMCVRDAGGRPVRLAGSVSDIDARKRVESALRESEERYQLAVAGSNEGLWDWDLASDLMFVSPRAQSFMGLAPSEPRRPRREWLTRGHTHPDDIPGVRAALSAHLHGSTQHLSVEFRMRHADGQWRWLRQRGIALRDAAGKPYRMAGSMEDISDTKRAEAERDRLESKLRQAQKLEAMGTLAGGIAHDFNNILSAILGYGEMAHKDAPENSRQRRHLEAVMHAGQRAKALVERILAFSRSGMGERVPIHVQSVVGEALDLVLASVPAGVVLRRRLEAGDAAVVGDPTQIHQVVMNLCTNAVQAMPAGGELDVSLTRMEMDSTTLATSTLAAGSYLRLTVADSGVGIPPNIIERIFDPFFTTKEVGVGSGLGLSLVHGIVTDLGGGIEVDSRPGAGARFNVYLPWRGEVKPQAPLAECIAQGAGQTVLVVDDEPALVELVEEMLAECGYEPVGYCSSTAALAAVREQPGRFDAVLSDQTMPGLTGEELARELRALRPDLPVVLMSGFVSAALVERARAAGVAEVLAKPLAQEEIARCLDALLRG